jgi:hypothetical protein
MNVIFFQYFKIFLYVCAKIKQAMKRLIQFLLLFVIITFIYMCFVSIQQGMREMNESETIELFENENSNS